MDTDTVSAFRPVSPPRVLDGVYSDDQFARVMKVIHDNAPWPLILAHHFKNPEEVLAASSGSVPEGVKLTWDMFLTPFFRGILGKAGVCYHPEIDDLYHNPKFLELARGYWNAPYAQPEGFLFNIQGPAPMGGSPHVDGTHFRGLSTDTTLPWLTNLMCKSQLFRQWQAKKAQVITWYYKGSIGGGFHYWPDGPAGQPQTLAAPMWNRGVVVENEMMYHTAQACGPQDMRAPKGLDIGSLIEPDPGSAGGWRITTRGETIQRIPEQEVRVLLHWGAQVYMSFDELKVTLDHSDDLTTGKVFDIFVSDLRKRGIAFKMPTDPMTDTEFMSVLIRAYDHGAPAIMPPEPEQLAA